MILRTVYSNTSGKLILRDPSLADVFQRRNMVRLMATVGGIVISPIIAREAIPIRSDQKTKNMQSNPYASAGINSTCLSMPSNFGGERSCKSMNTETETKATRNHPRKFPVGILK